MPLAGTAILLAGVALAGLPPFGLFASDLLITVGAYRARPEIAYAFLALLALAFATLFYQVFRMALGEPTESGRALGRPCRLFTATAIGVNLAVLGLIGLQVPAGFHSLLTAIVDIFGSGGGPP